VGFWKSRFRNLYFAIFSELARIIYSKIGKRDRGPRGSKKVEGLFCSKKETFFTKSSELTRLIDILPPKMKSSKSSIFDPFFLYILGFYKFEICSIWRCFCKKTPILRCANFIFVKKRELGLFYSCWQGEMGESARKHDFTFIYVVKMFVPLEKYKNWFYLHLRCKFIQKRPKKAKKRSIL